LSIPTDRSSGTEDSPEVQLTVPRNAEAVQHSSALLASESTPASGQQVEYQDDQRQNQEKVNHAAGNMETEAQQPQNENNYKDCPKHSRSFAAMRTHENCKTLRRPQALAIDYRLRAMALAFASLTASRNDCAETGTATSPLRMAPVVWSRP